MSEMNLRSVDLNLLVILDALLRERGITRAARTLAMTQPAVSHALQRLRIVFDDPLLERHGGEMRPTARAEGLGDGLAQILADVRQLTTATKPMVRASRRTLRVSMLDLAMSALLPPLLDAVSSHAPGLTLACLHWELADIEVERLRRGDVDLALTSLAALPADLRRERLGTIHYTGIARAGHPIFSEGRDPFDFPFVMVSSNGRTQGELDGVLAASGRHRHVAASLPQYLCIPAIVAQTDTLAFVPETLTRHLPSALDLRRFPAAPNLHPLPVDLVWHRRSETDNLHEWVRTALTAIARERLVSASAK